MPPPKLVRTADGSPTLEDAAGLAFHSRDGAVGESLHVFLDGGELQKRLQSAREAGEPVRVLEIGLGTGLNLLLSAALAAELHGTLHYTAIEPLPPPPAVLAGYLRALREALPSLQAAYPGAALHWPACIEEALHAFAATRADVSGRTAGLQWQLLRGEWPARAGELPPHSIDVVYYDAFGPADVPHMWAEAHLAAVLNQLKPGGALVTYAVTGELKRCLRRLGWAFERPAGFGRKRQMLRVRRGG